MKCWPEQRRHPARPSVRRVTSTHHIGDTDFAPLVSLFRQSLLDRHPQAFPAFFQVQRCEV